MIKYICVLIVVAILFGCESDSSLSDIDKVLKAQQKNNKNYSKDSLKYQVGLVGSSKQQIKYVIDRRTNKCFAIYNPYINTMCFACVPCDSIVMAHIINKDKPQKYKVINVIAKEDGTVEVDGTTTRIPEVSK